MLQAIIALNAWNELSVLQRAPWLGRLFAASILRQASITSGAHLVAINLGLKTISVDRRRHRDRETRLLPIAQGPLSATEIGMKEHDRLVLARTSSCSWLLSSTKRIVGREAASAIPSASRSSFFWALIYGRTYSGDIKRTS